MIELESLFEAYYDCRRGKRHSVNSLGFEVGYEDALVDLCHEINSHEYKPSRSIAFVVDKPVHREVFAADFRDRIIHHYIALRIEPLLEAQFTDRTFNCRKGKGTLCGVRRLHEDILLCSKHYTKDCYVLKMDIKSFFMSISKSLLNERMDEFICDKYNGSDKEDLRWLSSITIMHNPEENCICKSPEAKWEFLPPGKSLFLQNKDLGLAIGNLTSQLYANFYLDGFDHWMEDVLGFAYHGRYVDDFYIVDEDKSKLIASIPRIRGYLKTECRLTLHPNKVYIQHYSKGVKFTGAVVKKGRIYISNRTVANFQNLTHRLNHTESEDFEKVKKCADGMNSYLGLMKHTLSYAIRRKMLNKIGKNYFKYFYISGHFEKITIKKRYTDRINAINRVKEGGLNGYD